jgi:cyclopropane fatty-acyl-phospholipid synthase-like methyltransferase
MSSNIQWNRQNWDDPKRWETEWHGGYAWGDHEKVRRDFLRFVAPFLPVDRKPRVLEIACGMGRFTEFLLGVAEHVHAIDLAGHCVESCRARFPERCTVTQTDGKTLPDGQFDLVVSYDSLVHADFDVLKAYFEQSQAVLTVGGFLAIHHANREDFASSRTDVTSEMVLELVSGLPRLEMVSQTLFRFEQGHFVDCFTVARRV